MSFNWNNLINLQETFHPRKYFHSLCLTEKNVVALFIVNSLRRRLHTICQFYTPQYINLFTVFLIKLVNVAGSVAFLKVQTISTEILSKGLG